MYVNMIIFHYCDPREPKLKIERPKMVFERNKFRIFGIIKQNLKSLQIFRIIFFPTNLEFFELFLSFRITCSILASIEPIIVSIVVILMSIDPILEKCGHLQV